LLALRRSPLGTFDALTTSGVSQLLRALAVTAGIKKRVHPHLLRHSFATWALTHGMNPLTLAQIPDPERLRPPDASDVVPLRRCALGQTDAFMKPCRRLVAGCCHAS
jgi:hypothetical protein